MEKEAKPIHKQIINIVGGENRFREIAKIEPKQECCQDITGFYLGTTCSECNQPFRSVIEEVAFRLFPKKVNDIFSKENEEKRGVLRLGAKLQQKRSYSEEEVDKLISLLKQTTEYEVLQSFRDKVEQFKNK